jgi:thymidylate synthase (methanogen type)
MEAMMEIHEETIGQAHESVVRAIFEDGHEKTVETEPGKKMVTWSYPEAITTIIDKPWKEPLTSKALPYGPGMINQYKVDMVKVGPTGFAYTYPNRLFDYPEVDTNWDSETVMYGNGDGDGTDQVQLLVNRLVEDHGSRRALATTWVPSIDGTATEPPCLQFIHCLLRKTGRVVDNFCGNGEYDIYAMDMRAAFRSHDMLLGAGPNWIGLTGVMELIITMLANQWTQPVETGSLTTFSSDAHIYVESQAEEIKAFKRVLQIS